MDEGLDTLREASLLMRNLLSRFSYDDKRRTWKLDGVVSMLEWKAINLSIEALDHRIESLSAEKIIAKKIEEFSL